MMNTVAERLAPFLPGPDEFYPPGGWRRVAWTWCWNQGKQVEFPQLEPQTETLRRDLQAHLVGLGSSEKRAAAVTKWAIFEYMKDRRGMWEHRHEPPPVNPMRPYPVFLVTDLPHLMRKPNGRGRYRSLVQFSKDWAVYPLRRKEMMADPPPPDTEFGIAVSIAAVVHALCDLDGLPPPNWVFAHRSPEPMKPWGVSPSLKPEFTSKTPPACLYHNVFFDYHFIEGPLWISLPPTACRNNPEEALSR